MPPPLMVIHISLLLWVPSCRLPVMTNSSHFHLRLLSFDCSLTSKLKPLFLFAQNNSQCPFIPLISFSQLLFHFLFTVFTFTTPGLHWKVQWHHCTKASRNSLLHWTVSATYPVPMFRDCYSRPHKSS